MGIFMILENEGKNVYFIKFFFPYLIYKIRWFRMKHNHNSFKIEIILMLRSGNHSYKNKLPTDSFSFLDRNCMISFWRLSQKSYTSTSIVVELLNFYRLFIILFCVLVFWALWNVSSHIIYITSISFMMITSRNYLNLRSWPI